MVRHLAGGGKMISQNPVLTNGGSIKDMKRGYCESGITQEQIDAYQKSKNVGHLMEDGSKVSTIKDAKSGKHDYENDDDTKR